MKLPVEGLSNTKSYSSTQMASMSRINGNATKRIRVQAGSLKYSKEDKESALKYSQEMIGARNTTTTSKGNNSNWTKFADWCANHEEYSDPRLGRQVWLPEAIVCYVAFLMMPDEHDQCPSMNVANKARGGISDYYKYHSDGTGGTQWFIRDGTPYGNPTMAPNVCGLFQGRTAPN